MNKIKILFITSQFKAMGGAEKNLLDLVTGLDANAFDTQLAVLQSGPLISSMLRHVPVWDVALKKIFSLDGLFKGIRLIRLLKKEKISVVITYHHDADLWGGLFSLLAGVPVVISSRRDMGYLLSAKHIWCHRILNRFITKIISTSDAVKDVVSKREWVSPKKIITVYNGVELNRYAVPVNVREKKIQLGLDPDKKTIGMVANFRSKKGQEHFVASAAEILKDFPDTQFLLVGYKNTPYYLKVEQQIKDLKIENAVHCPGARLDIPEILKTLDVFVLCSTGEGFSNAILEAMASGVFVIASRSGGNPEAVFDYKTGLLIDPENSVQLTQAISTALNSPLLRSALVRSAGHMLKKRFTRDEMLKNISSLLFSLTQMRNKRNRLSKTIFYPLWDIYDRSVKLKELKRLEKTQWTLPRERAQEQWRKLQAFVTFSMLKVPYYRNEKYRPINSLEDFRRLPLLQKDDIRAHKDELISTGHNKKKLVQAKTGGSTGVSLEVYFDKRCQERRNAATLLMDRWSGWNLGQPKGALWGNPPLPVTFRQKFRNRWLDKLTYLDTVNLNERDMDAFIQEIETKNIRTLYGHSHSLFIFANYVRAKKHADIKMNSILSTSMSLLPSERQVIESVFGCKVTNRYGCEEVGVIACECERHNGLHLNMDHLYVELIKNDGTPALPGEEGNIVVTDMINRGMPLIRYAVGDVGVLAERLCPCGRTSALLEKIVGRTADFLVKQDGSLVAGVSLVERTLTAIPGIAQLQIIQERLSKVNLNMVTDEYYTSETERRLDSEIRRVLGNIEIQINKTQKLEQQKNGKYRFSICKVDNPYQKVADEVRA